MAKPVDHNLASGTATTGWEAVKGGVKGGLFPIVLGAIALGGIAYLGASMIAAGSIGGAVSWLAGLSIPAKIGIAGAAIGAWVGGGFAAIGAAVGAVFGVFKGASKVSRENTAYKLRENDHALAMASRASTLEQSSQAIAQQAYVAGQQSVINQLHEMRDAAIREQMAAAPQKSHVEAEMKRREAAASATPQVS